MSVTVSEDHALRTLPRLELGEDSNHVMVEVDLDKVHEFFTCNVCKGFFREPHTIPECVHTFCKSCIVERLQYTQECPTCKSKTTLNNVRPDHTVQSLFAKLFPEAEKEDEEHEKRWYESNNIPMPERQQPQQSSRTAPKPGKPEASKRQRSDQTASSGGASSNAKDGSSNPPAKNAAVRLRLEVRAEPGVQSLAEPYLEAASTTKVEKMRLYIARQLQVSPEHVVISCEGQVLPLEHTAEFVQRTRWRDPTTNMVWRYKLV